MLILGEKESTSETVSVRGRSGKDHGTQKLEEFIPFIKKEIEEKRTKTE